MAQRWAVSFRSSESLRDAERPTDGAGQHPCARGQWCARRTVVTTDGKKETIPALTYRAFCDHDRDLIAHCLDDFPAIYVRLHCEIGKPSVTGSTIRMPFGPSVPLRLDVDLVMRLLVSVVESWHERVATVASLAAVDTYTTHLQANSLAAGRLMARSAKVLGAHLDALLALEPGPMARPAPRAQAITEGTAPEVIVTFGDEAMVMLDGAYAGNELLHLHYWCRSVLQETAPRPEELLGVECRECSLRTLRRAEPPWHDGDPEYYSECAECGAVMSEDLYRLWVAQLDAYHRIRLDLPRTGMPARVA